MSNPPTEMPLRTHSLLLRLVASFLFFGAGLSVVILFFPAAAALGATYQAYLAAASIVTAVAAYGLWKHMKWGAWTYIALTAINQPFLYLMGWWIAGALIIPSILILLIFAKFKWLK